MTALTVVESLDQAHCLLPEPLRFAVLTGKNGPPAPGHMSISCVGMGSVVEVTNEEEGLQDAWWRGGVVAIQVRDKP